MSIYEYELDTFGTYFDYKCWLQPNKIHPLSNNQGHKSGLISS